MSSGAGAESIQYQLFMLALCVCLLVALAAEASLRRKVETGLRFQYPDIATSGVSLESMFTLTASREWKLGSSNRGQTRTAHVGWRAR